MIAATEALLPARAVSEPPAARRLRAVDAPAPRRKRPRLVYAIAAVAGAVAIALGQMALSIVMTEGAYELAQLSQQRSELTWEKQALYDDVAGLSSPQYLAANAAALGMVIDSSPTYLRLSDGAIVGTGEAAGTASSVDAATRGAVGNTLVAETPLVTAPDATIHGVPVDAAAKADGRALPPPLTDGLPTPSTR